MFFWGDWIGEGKSKNNPPPKVQKSQSFPTAPPPKTRALFGEPCRAVPGLNNPLCQYVTFARPFRPGPMQSLPPTTPKCFVWGEETKLLVIVAGLQLTVQGALLAGSFVSPSQLVCCVLDVTRRIIVISVSLICENFTELLEFIYLYPLRMV